VAGAGAYARSRQTRRRWRRTQRFSLRSGWRQPAVSYRSYSWRRVSPKVTLSSQTCPVPLRGFPFVAVRADARAADLTPTIADIQASGARSLRAIAAELNRRGIRTPRGRVAGRERDAIAGAAGAVKFV
jgi:hypothetical protein